MSRMRDCSDCPCVVAVLQSTFVRFQSFAILPYDDGCSKQMCTRLEGQRALAAMEMRTPPMLLYSFVDPKCAWPKREPLIALYAKLTESGSARPRNWEHNHPPFRLRAKRERSTHRTETAVLMASPDCGTSSAS